MRYNPPNWDKRAITNLYRSAVRFLTKGSLLIVNYARGNLKVGTGQKDGGRASGMLARSINFSIDDKALVARIGSNLLYAKYVEGIIDGQVRPGATRRYFVPFRVAHTFERWAARRGFQTKTKSGKVTGGMWVWGYRIPFLSKAYAQARDELKRMAKEIRLSA
jgi:hypothetical protein